MANLGEITEIINASEVTLEVGSDSYILLKNLDITVGRPEFRDATVGGGPLYTYGQGDIVFTGTLLASTPEIDSLNTLTQTDSNGDLTSTAWKLVYKNVAGATKTFAATGVLTNYTLRKGEEGKVEIDIRVRVTADTVTIS